jgi:S1-C subfamily serine protease
MTLSPGGLTAISLDKKVDMKVQNILVIACGCILCGCSSLGEPGAAQPTARIAVRDSPGFQDSIAAVSDAALPCVVHIDVSGSTLEQIPRLGPFGLSGAPQGISKVPMRALGSGILVSPDGLIVTNNHVVENADTITVHFYDGTERPARLVGSDRFTDIAVLKVEGTGSARVARMGDSDALRVGEWVVAIGSPRGLDWTVTAGIVSATHRLGVDTKAPAGLEDFIQTDTAINPGNSGGPLLNLRGEVIGMNALIVSGSHGSEGLGFAIPSNTLSAVAQTLIRHGRVIRGDLGVQTQDLDGPIRKSLKLPADVRGAIVTEAVPLGPAAAAALQAGDLITSFQQTTISSAAQLNRLIAASAPGTSLVLKVLRDGVPFAITVTVADQLELAQRQAARPGYALLGLRVNPVSESLAKDVGLSETAGVVVEEVVTGSPADNVGIAKGDIIFQVDGEDVNNQEQFRARVGDAIQAGSVVVLLRDGGSGKTGYLEIPIR